MSNLAAPVLTAFMCDCSMDGFMRQADDLRSAASSCESSKKRKFGHLEEEIVAHHNDRTIRVTGPGGFPLYAERHINYMVRDGILGDGDLELPLLNSTGNYRMPGLATCPVEDIERCELHVGNQKFVLGSERGNLTSERDPHHTVYYSVGSGSQKMFVTVEFGPNRFHHNGDNYDPRAFKGTGIEFVRFTEVCFETYPFQNDYP